MKIVPIISQVDGTSRRGGYYQQIASIVRPLAQRKARWIPADLRLGPHSQSRGSFGQPRTFGVLGVASCSNRSSPAALGPLSWRHGLRNYSENGRQGLGLEHHGPLFILAADLFGLMQPFRAKL